MCMEDVLIGRAALRGEDYKAVTAAASLVLPQDSDCFSLIIDNLGPNDVFLGFTSTVSPLRGLRITATDPPLRLSVERDGRIVTDGLWAVCAAAETATLAIWSTFMDRKK